MRYVYIAPAVGKVCVGYGRYGSEERRMNLLADVVEYDLGRHGIKTARNSADMSACEAVADANARECGVYIALHTGSADSVQRGGCVYYLNKETNAERLALEIKEAISEITECETEESAKEYGGLSYYELCKTKATAVIIAVGFHDNPADAEFIIMHTYELGCLIARGILRYYGVEYRADGKSNADNMRASYNGVIF